MKRSVEVVQADDQSRGSRKWIGSILAVVLFGSALAVIFIPEITWQWGGVLALGLFVLIPIFSFLSKVKLH